MRSSGNTASKAYTGCNGKPFGAMSWILSWRENESSVVAYYAANFAAVEMRCIIPATHGFLCGCGMSFPRHSQKAAARHPSPLSHRAANGSPKTFPGNPQKNRIMMNIFTCKPVPFVFYFTIIVPLMAEKYLLTVNVIMFPQIG